MNELARHYSEALMGRGASRSGAPVEEVGYYYSDQTENAHLRDYWKILLKRIRPIAAVFVDVMIIGAIITLASPTLYTARSVLKIEPQNPAVTGVAGVVMSVFVASAFFGLIAFTSEVSGATRVALRPDTLYAAVPPGSASGARRPSGSCSPTSRRYRCPTASTSTSAPPSASRP